MADNVRSAASPDYPPAVEEAILPDAEARQAQHHFKNFDVIRLVAASSVIFSHSVLIVTGSEDTEPFKMLSGDILGIFGVFVFFIVSGLLVTESAMAKPGTAPFAWRRFLRIYPAYLVCNLLTFAVIAFFFYEYGSPLDFLRTNWGAILENLTYKDVSGWMDGVAFYEPTAAQAERAMHQEFNGSLWSLQMEVLCYLGLANLIAARWLSPQLCLAGIALGTVLLIANSSNNFVTNVIYSAPSFAAGVFIWYVLQRHRPTLLLAGVALAILVVATYTKTLLYVFPLPAAYILLYLGVSAPFDIRAPKWLGDISYGTYLYGWPIQQLVRAWLGPDATWQELFYISTPLALLAGFLSWHLLEKRALAFKNVVPFQAPIAPAPAQNLRSA